MRLFLLVYILVYGGAHVYAFIKLIKGFSPGLMKSLVLAGFMGGMVAAPIGVRMLEHSGWYVSARWLACVGYTWMGFVFIFVSTWFLFDICRLFYFFVCKAGLLSPFSDRNYVFRVLNLVSITLSLAVVIYSCFEALHICTEQVTITTDKLPHNIEKVRVVQISDVHLGLIVGRYRLQRIIDQVEKAGPDMLISTGDLADGDMDKSDKLADMLKNIPVTYGKYAVTGNHEFYAGLNRSLEFTRRAGFQVLQGEGVTNVLNIAGVDDPGRGRVHQNTSVFEKTLLLSLPREKFTLFLKHQPVVSPDALGYFDLQLSGHTHKGQIFPFSLVTKLKYPLHSGLVELQDNSRIYISRGSGTWGPPLRFLSPPEVTIIDIVNQP